MRLSLPKTVPVSAAEQGDVREGAGQSGLQGPFVAGVVQVADVAGALGIGDGCDGAGLVVAGGAGDAAGHRGGLLPAHSVELEPDFLGARRDGGEDAGHVEAVAGRLAARGHRLAAVGRVVLVADRAVGAGHRLGPVVGVVGEGLVAGLAVVDLLEQVVAVVVVTDTGFGLPGDVDAVLGGLGPAQEVVGGERDLPGTAGRLPEQTGRVVLERGLGTHGVGGRPGAVRVVVLPPGRTVPGVGEGGEVAVVVVVEARRPAEGVGDLAGLVQLVVDDGGQ